jgi:multidrug efflux pump subunit AcrA (membrane-fusion protein)
VVRSESALAVCLILCSLGCKGSLSGNGSGAPGRGRGRGGAPVNIETTTVQKISVQRTVDLSGTLISLDQAKVSSEVAGVVAQVPVELGAEVKVGDVLVAVQPRELQIAVDRAESALRQVEAQLGVSTAERRDPPPDEEVATVRQALANRDDARAAFARADQLSSRGLLSRVDRDTAETRLKVMEANYQASLDAARSLRASLQDRRAAYDLALKKLNDATIKAPIAGSVAERLVQTGEYIKENTPVVTVVQMNPLKLRTGIQEKYAGMIREGQPVDFRVEAFPERAFNGKVAYVSPAVDQSTRTFAVEAIVDNPDRVLKPGFFAKGAVRLRVDDNVKAVADDAVSTLAGVSTVYVVDQGKARQQIVTLGVHQDRTWEIVEGLKGDETLASSQLNQLATGMNVTTGGGRGRGAAADGALDGSARRNGGKPESN